MEYYFRNWSNISIDFYSGAKQLLIYIDPGLFMTLDLV